MHILTTSQTYPYSVSQLRRDNPQTSFPKAPTDELLATFNVFPALKAMCSRPCFKPCVPFLGSDSGCGLGFSVDLKRPALAAGEEEGKRR